MKKLLTKIKRKKRIKERKISMKNASFSLFEVVSIIVITAVVVSLCSSVIVFTNYNKINSKFNKTPTGDAYNELATTYNHIVQSYVNDIDESKLVDSAIEGMFNYLEDVNTDYLGEDETETLQEKLSGKYTGIGIEIQSIDGKIILTDVFDNSPASKAGLKKDDILVSINDDSLENKDASYLASILKKEANLSFKIGYKRNGEIYYTNVQSSNVSIPSVTSEMKGNVGYIKISTFASNTLEQFTSALKDIEHQNNAGLVIDVRNNTGGYLDSAYNIADLFIKKDKIIYQLRDKSGVKTSYKAKNADFRSYKVVILINGSSASASEILAASLRDVNGALLIGTNSYGKGTVQNTEELSGGSMIKYTTAYWLTPNGICIDKIGLKPDIKVDFNIEEDKQLTAALNQFK